MNFSAYPAERRRALAKYAAWKRWGSKKPESFQQARDIAQGHAIAQGKPLNAVSLNRVAKAFLTGVIE